MLPPRDGLAISGGRQMLAGVDKIIEEPIYASINAKAKELREMTLNSGGGRVALRRVESSERLTTYGRSKS
jgi:hypothetical protein